MPFASSVISTGRGEWRKSFCWRCAWHGEDFSVRLRLGRKDEGGARGLVSGEVVLGVEGGAATHAGCADGLSVGAVDAVAGGEYAGGGGAG